MKIKVIASTKVGYELPKEEAVDFSGKSAGICYLPDTLETLFSEDKEKTQKRANGTLVKDLQTISIPDEKINLYTDKISKEISVEVGILSKEKVNFYGV